jgi:hypothetical protein
MDAEGLRRQVAEFEPVQLPDIELVVFLVEFRRLADAVEACWVRLVGEFDRRELWRADGARSAGGWLRRECRMTRQATTIAVAAARALEDLPATGEAFRQGYCSLSHVRAITTAVGPARREQVRKVDSVFARAALWMDPAQVARVARTWSQLADPG